MNAPYKHIKHGTFTRDFNKRSSDLSHLSNLHDFAEHVLSHTDQHSDKTIKRARFYLNMIERPKGGALEVDTMKALIENSYKHDKHQIGAFALQPISTKTTQVWANSLVKHIVIVFTGTYNTLDWLNNAQYLVGNYKKTERFKSAEKVFDEAVNKYKGFKITLLGHSQGAIPEHLLLDNRVFEALYLNPAWTNEKQMSNEYIVKSTRDPVSLLVPRNKNNLFIPAKTMNPLHEHSSLILNNLPQDKLIGRGTYKEDFNKKHGFDKDESHSIEEISKLSGYKEEGLHTIFDKGIGAYHTNPQSVRPNVHSAEQWANSRVYASINPTSKASRVDASHLIKGGELDFNMMTRKQLIDYLKSR